MSNNSTPETGVEAAPESVSLDLSKLLGFRTFVSDAETATDLREAVDAVHNKIGEVPPGEGGVTAA